MAHHHPHPSRREFIAGAVTGTASFLLMPSLLSEVFSQVARAEMPRNPQFPAFLVFDMNGGSALVGNFLVGNKNGAEDLLTSYSYLGWNPKVDPLDRRFGLPMAWGPNEISKILKGILEAASPEAQAGLRIGSFCHTSQDDSATNQHSAASLIAMAGARGTLVESCLGTRSSNSGGNTTVPFFDSILKSLYIGGVDDIFAAVKYHKALSQLSPDTLRSLGNTILGLNREQSRRLSKMTFGEQLFQLTDRAVRKNIEVSESAGELDPRTDSDCKRIYNISETTKQDSVDAIRATVVMNALKGQTGPGTIMIDGCDYHDGSPVNGNIKDLETGKEIGRAIELAYRMKKPLIFQLLTDGGISAPPGTRDWNADDQEKTMTLLGYYHPNAAPAQRRLQVGHFTNGQGAARDTLIGADTTQVAYSVLANYLTISKSMNLFTPIVGNRFPIEKLDEVLIFG